jgi:uncharacterized membrane protein YesL
MKLFNLDSPIMVLLGKMADLMIINILTILCSLPLITVGPAFRAAHYVCLKIVRDEECYIIRSYFKSFKENFVQGTLIWIMILAAAGILAGDYFIITKSGLEFSRVLKIAIIVVGVVVVFMTVYVFPSLAKFDNTIWATIKNSFLMSIWQFPKTILMLIIYVAPIILAIFVYQAIPVVMLLGIAVPVYLSAMLYNKFFQVLEDQIIGAQEAAQGEQEEDPDKIFSDKLDEALIEEHMNQQ